MLRRDANQTAPPHKSTVGQASGALVPKDPPLFYAQGLTLDKDANLFNPNSFNLFLFFFDPHSSHICTVSNSTTGLS